LSCQASAQFCRRCQTSPDARLHRPAPVGAHHG
jgi:hypothetical protein